MNICSVNVIENALVYSNVENIMAKVSIIMGAYNCEDTLNEAIDSILNQTFDDWEFIICDDASSDSTLSILNEYKELYPNKFVILHNNNNLMLSGSLNRCLEKSTGMYIARMDADDISMPNRIEKQVEFLDTHKEYSVVGTFMQSFDELGKHNIIPNRQRPTKYDLPKFNSFHHATILMRKDVYDNLGGYTVSERTRRVEDLDLWFRFFEKGYEGYTISEPLYLVREDNDAFKRRKFKYNIDTAKVICKGIKRLDLPVKYYIYVLKPIVSFFVPKNIKAIFRKKYSKQEEK